MVELIQAIAQNSEQLWAQILITIAALGAFLKGIEAILQIVAPLTPWTWDDNIATMLGKIVANKIFHKKV